MRVKKRLGEMLVEAGHLTEEQLEGLLVEQRSTGLKLGQFLVKRNIVPEETIVDTVSRQLGVERFQPKAYPLDLSLAELLSPELARKHGVAPLAKRGKLLKLAMLDPTDLRALDYLEFELGMECEPVICIEQELQQLISSIYGIRTDLGSLMENIGDIQLESVDDDDSSIDVGRASSEADEAPIIRLVNSILMQGVHERASDIHISPEKNYVQVRFRIDGRLQEVPAPPKHLAPSIVSRFKIMSNLDISVTRVPQDGRFTMKVEDKDINVRVSTLPTIYGENLVLRVLNSTSKPLTLDKLGMSGPDMTKLKVALDKPYGMLLATGPTGSGKSTSLYALLSEINTSDINIITLEDPVENRIEKVRQVQLNVKAGMTFASGLRSILRQDPDVIMVGEIRDAETARIAVQAAQTGHRVLSTVHTNDAVGAVTRLADMGVEPFLISATLLVSIAQRLVRRVCPECSRPHVPDPAILDAWGLSGVDVSNFRKGKGCQACMNTGYRGRIGVYEILAIDETIQDMIVKRCSAGDIKNKAVQTGLLTTLRDDAARQAVMGNTTLEEAATAAMT